MMKKQLYQKSVISLRRDPRHGFTLIEVIVAIGIFGIGVLAIIGFYAISVQAIRNSRQVTTATALAQGIIEEKIAEPYDSLIVGEGLKEAFSTDSADPTYLYQKKVDISLINQDLAASGTDLGLKKIDVYVYWQGPSEEKKVQLSTITIQR